MESTGKSVAVGCVMLVCACTGFFGYEISPGKSMGIKFQLEHMQEHFYILVVAVYVYMELMLTSYPY